MEAEVRKVSKKNWVLQGPRHQEVTLHWCRQRPVERDFIDPAGSEFWPVEPIQVWRLQSRSDRAVSTVIQMSGDSICLQALASTPRPICKLGNKFGASQMLPMLL